MPTDPLPAALREAVEIMALEIGAARYGYCDRSDTPNTWAVVEEDATTALRALLDQGFGLSQWLPGETLPSPERRPGRCFIRVEGWSAHDGGPHTWERVHCGMASTSSETHWGFRKSDIYKIMKDGDMDGIDAITHWMPATFPPLRARGSGR